MRFELRRKIVILIVTLLVVGCAFFIPATHNETKKKNAVEKYELPEVKLPDYDNKIIVSENKKSDSKEALNYVLENIKIENKKNGLLITLGYKGDDPKENITTFFSGDNFFNISFYKGKFSKSVKNHIYNKSIIGSVKFFEFKDSSQITMRLRRNHKSSYIDTDGNNVIISIFN